MKKRILIVLFTVLFLTACQKNFENNGPQKKSENGNHYAVKKVLILAKAGEVKDEVLKSLISRLKSNYFISVDDLDQIYEYSFYDHNAVVIIESPEEKGFTRTEAYLDNYGGVNNIVFIGVVPPGIDQKAIEKYQQKFKIDAFFVEDNSAEKMAEIAERIRKK